MRNLYARMDRLERLELEEKQRQSMPFMVREGETTAQALERQGLTSAAARRNAFPIIDEFPSSD